MPIGVVLAVILTLSTGCGEDEPETGSEETEIIEVTFEDGAVTPNGERVEVGVDQPIELVVTADEAGEIHVHADPEQELPYGPGTTTLKLSLREPGVVEVESHELELVIVALQVS